MAEEAKKTDSIQDIEVDGYSFKADLDLLDDVEAFEIIDRIENKGQVAAIVPLLEFLIGKPEYTKMKVAFAEKDAAAHNAKLKEEGKPADPDYKGRFRISKLNDVYMAIIEKYNPKD